MLRVPARFAAILVAFAPVFVQARTWQHAQMLVLGALLVPGQRTVCSILRIIGLGQERHFVTWHRVLSHAVWDNRLAARLLLKLLVDTFVPTGPVLLAWTTASSAAAASRSAPRASTATRCGPRGGSSSRPAGCAG